MEKESPRFLAGAKAVDDRGSVSFVNDFNLADYRRFYTVTNHSSGFIRAWHGHLKESKAITVISGAALIGCAELTSNINPDKEVSVTRVVVSEHNPGVLLIPKGYANGIMTLTDDAVVLVFSDTSVEESINDDYRFPFDYWDIWKIEKR